MKILFVYQALSTFVKKDLDILCSAHEVRPIRFTGRKGLARNLIPDLWQLWQGVLWCDLTFSWFGKLHAFFAVLFTKVLGKRAVVVSGGDEVENCLIGGKKWGLCSHPLKRLFPLMTFRYADLILAHSEYNLHSTLVNTNAPPKRTFLIFHGFDADIFQPNSERQRESVVVTVGRIDNEHLYRKGHRLFVESAHYLPDVSFRLVGPVGEESAYKLLLDLAPSNVRFEGGLYGADLVGLLGQAKVYVQASECESFACSVAEAMLCECIPVVSRRTALPEVVGDCGVYVNSLEAEALATKIKEALQASPELGKRARQRIMKNFSLERRKKELLKAVSLLGDQR